MTADQSHTARAEIEVPGTPEEVWQAIATGPGITSWFLPTELEERAGGAMTMHHAPGADDPCTITAYDAPHRFAYEEEVGGSTLAHEVLVEARAGGTCLVRIVSSGFGPADDALREAMEAGWRGYLDNLRLVRTHFPGQSAATVLARAAAPQPAADALAALLEATGLAGATPGDRVAAAPPDGPRLAGIVERVGREEVALRLDGEVPGLAMVYAYPTGRETSAVQVHLSRFGPDARAAAAREEPAWRAWLARRFGRAASFEVAVTGTPEQVWEAIATGPGISVWFVPTELEEQPGGTVTQRHDQGPGGVVTGTVGVWEPPRRFGWVDDGGWQPGPDASTEHLATELLVEARAGGTCLVRLVSSGFGTGADWDDAIERVSDGWALCLAVLREVLDHFAGQPSAAFLLNGSADGPVERGWSEVLQALGLPADAAVGNRVATSGSGVPALAGTVAYVTPQHLVVRTDEPAPGILTLMSADMGGRTMVRVQGAVFGEDAAERARAIERAWLTWVDERFPMVMPVG